MTTTTHPRGFRHELVLHDGLDELVDLMVPFMRDGAAAGDDVVVVGEPDFVERLLTAAPDVPTTEIIAEPGRERFPGRDLHRFERLLARPRRTGARLRVVNQMPAMTTTQWLEWRRYEAAVNVVLAPYRAWGTCAHDRRRLDPAMLADLEASHPLVRTSDGRRPSEQFGHLDAYARDYLKVTRHPVDGTEPTLTLADPTAEAARRAVGHLALACGLSPTAQESVVLATSEAVTNGQVHGRAPVLLRAWTAGPGQITVAVSDAGAGPDPLVGLIAAPPDSLSGRGMWLVHLLLGDIHHRIGADGYTITFGADSTGPHAA